MPNFRVRVTETVVYTIEVEAVDQNSACNAAHEWIDDWGVELSTELCDCGADLSRGIQVLP